MVSRLFTLTLRSASDSDADTYRRLKNLLKTAWRRDRMKCVDIREETSAESRDSARERSGHHESKDTKNVKN